MDIHSPKQVLTELKQQFKLLQSLSDEYKGKKKGSIYIRRLSSIQKRINAIGKKFKGLGKFSIKVYEGEFENGINFKFLYDASIPEEEVIAYLEFLQFTSVKQYTVKNIIKTGEIIFTSKNRNTESTDSCTI